MVLNMGGTWFSDAGNSFAAGKTTTKKYAVNTENGTEESSDKSGSADTDASSNKNGQTEGPSDNNDNTDAAVSNDSNAKTEDTSENKADNKVESADPSDSKTEKDNADPEGKLADRKIKAKVEEAVLYENKDGKNKSSEALSRVNAFIKALAGEKPKIDEGSKAPAEVTISGELPEGVTAEARYICFDKPDGDDKSAENALFSLDITLKDAKGKVYIPEGPLTISIEGSSIKDAADDEGHILVYSYDENARRSETLAIEDAKDTYAADSLVYKEEGTDDDALLYETYDRDKEYKDNEDAVRFIEESNGLARDEDDDSVISFEYDAKWSKDSAFGDDSGKDDEDEAAAGIPAHFVLSAQKSAEELEKIKEGQKKDTANTDEKAAKDKKADDVKKEVTDGKDKDAAKDEKAETGSGVLTATDGKTYKVTLTYDETAGIPEGTELNVQALRESGRKYEEYVDKSAETLNTDTDNVSFAHVLDITLTDPRSGDEIEPMGNVDVSVELLNDKIGNKTKVGVVHFREEEQDGFLWFKKTVEEPEEVESSMNGNNVEFTADGFSEYVIVGYTVDFIWGNYVYNMQGHTEVTLSTLLAQLFIDQFTVEDISFVRFSDPKLISVTKTESDWLLKSLKPFDTEETLTITLDDGRSFDIRVTDEQDKEPVIVSGEGITLRREYLYLEGSWAYWKVVVNENGNRLNGGNPLTLEDTFNDELKIDASQSIDYGRINVTGDGVTYDYSGFTGTYMIPDETPVTITYRTRIAAKAGERVTFRGTAKLKYGMNSVQSTAGVIDNGVVIYPSASDVAGFGSNYMVKMYVYADQAMQTGLSGAAFILLDENQRPLEYKIGENKGQPVTFTTGDDGYVNIELHEEKGDVAIEKNTGYYLEMIQAPSGYQKDNTLYSFMITDDPSYKTGDFYKYYNGDTMKVRLYDAIKGLCVSLRFSGSYSLNEDQQNNVTAVLQKNVGDTWIEVERHKYTDTKWGYIKFNSELKSDDRYRVVEENAIPWDLPEDINVTTSYYCIIDDGTSEKYDEPKDFEAGPDNSINVVIDNRYEEPQLTIVKMDKSTGETLTGAEFDVFRIRNGSQEGESVNTYTTDLKGKLVIRGGDPYESEVLYGIKETKAPSGYLLPHTDNWRYFYFCNDPYREPSILANLPEGATAINLTKSGDLVSLDNQKELITVPVMKVWQGNSWPEDVDSVTVGLYKSVDGSDPEPVTDEAGNKTVMLTAAAPYNDAFKNLPSRDEEGKDIEYSIKEEKITVNDSDKEPLQAGYVQEYGVSDAGVYVVRNKPSTSLSINKEWYKRNGWDAEDKITDDTTLRAQLPVTFDVYRTTETIPPEIKEGGITNDEMRNFLEGAKKVREGLTLDHEHGWTMTIDDLDLKDDSNTKYNYYVLENIPSYCDELYEVDETSGEVTIKNKVAPVARKLTVTKAHLVDDPRPESKDTEFVFTVKLNTENGKHPIRSWQIREGMVTDWEGEATFKLKPEESIELALPDGVEATITEAYNHEYTVKSKFNDEDETTGRSYTYTVTQDTDNAVLTYTNTLRVVCKVVNNSGEEIPYESINSALTRLRNPESGESFRTPWTIYMIEDYDIPETDIVDVGQNESLMLTTAPTTGCRFPFKGGKEATRATITRAANGGSMIRNANTLTLENIVLDGNKEGKYTSAENGGLINSSGTLNLNNKTILRNSESSGTGGAVYASGTVNMNNGEDGAEISGNSAASASAMYLSGTLNMTCGTISGNSGASDGAVVVKSTTDRIYLSGKPKITENTGTAGTAANLYVGADSDNIVNVINPGLLETAEIGITAQEGHMEIDEQFAFADLGMTDNLGRFINDKYGYKGKLKVGTSTNVVWDGLNMNIIKKFDPGDIEGTNPDDRFTITISSAKLYRSTYTIDGTLDYTVRPSSGTNPGSIVLRNIKAGDNIAISPLPVGEYTVTETSTAENFNYEAVYSVETEAGVPVSVNDGKFNTDTDCTVTVTNHRRKAEVNLTKSLVDQLATGTVDFPFTIMLTEQDGKPIEDFTILDGTKTNSDGKAVVTFKPSNSVDDEMTFNAPVGAVMTITEAENSNYRVTVNEKDKEEHEDNVFVIQSVTDDGADIEFHNRRKVANIELSKVLKNKVSANESFTFELTLTNSDGTKASGYTMYQNPEGPDDHNTTNSEGKATKKFSFGKNESSKSVVLSIPEGSKLEVKETGASSESGKTDFIDLFKRSIKVNGDPIVDPLHPNPLEYTFKSVSDSDKSIEFTNERDTRTITVTNTVSGYSGNTEPFKYTATVTDGNGAENDYDANGFTDGVQTFELATGQSKELVVPRGSSLTVAQTFIVGYETSITREGSTSINKLVETFPITSNDQTVAFTNTQLIKLLLVNNTSSDLANVKVYNQYSGVMYRVNDDETGQDTVPVPSDHWSTVDVANGKTAILMVRHPNSVTDEKNYTVKGTMPADGYYYTIKNEPSFHEYADPAVMRVYGRDAFEVKGKFRYSVSDSTVTFSEQPLVSFDVNGGAWTTEMEDYHDRDGDRQVYQNAVNTGETVSKPSDPVYPTEEGITFLGWTTDEEYAKQDHSEDTEIDPEKKYDFDTPVTAPVTLYAVWKKAVRNNCVVTLKNSTGNQLTVSTGSTSIVLPVGESRNHSVDNGTALSLTLDTAALAVSSQYTITASGDKKTYTVDSVVRDGTITFIAGICKITDADDKTLYKADGTPAVYQTLEAAFTDYDGDLYTDSTHTTKASQAKVKMLIDEYPVSKIHYFPNKAVILTTAGKDDQSFPYVGVRDRATLYRAGSFSDKTLFTNINNKAATVTLTDIILDGKEVELAKGANGGLIHINNTGAVLTIDAGTTLRNVQYSDYSDGNNSRGGAIYVQSGTLNVNAGLFTNLHARRGGAICSVGTNSKLSITGQNGSTRFENCYAEREDGGAVFYENANSDLTIDGGENNGVNVEKNGDQWVETPKDNPGIVFIDCQAKASDSDGGAVFANTNYGKDVTIKGCAFTECSAKNTSGKSDEGYGGGAICAQNVKLLTVSYCSFSSCDTLKSGGAIVARVKSTTNDEDTFSVSNCTFSYCSCKAQGGALGVYTSDYRTATTSRTKLKVHESTIKNCSSGTDNGSGGAIQCYLPVMDFDKIIVSDCWAGKEGGAVNNYYGNGYTQVWQNSRMDVTDCRFIRCRAEDRYDPTALQHYGGGINSKAKIANVKGSYFEDCVSTIKEGGALHLGGQNDGSKATVEDTTFKNCMAKNGGGAMLSSNETLEIDNCFFYGCGSSASNGGAIYHKENSRGGSTQKNTRVKNSTFSADPNDPKSSGCNAALNGGAIWTRATTEVTLENLTIMDAVAGANGGGVYLDSKTTEATINGGSITGCQAVYGSAVYVGTKATFTADLNISENVVSSVNDGAIHGGKLYFEGNVKVKDNTCSSDSTYDHDVLMQNDNEAIIYTTSAGLGVNADIGVYVPDQYFNKRGVEGKAFGTYNNSNYLESFFNDRDDELFGYQLAEGDTRIYWGSFVCKITDSDGNTLKRPNGRDAVYIRISQALDEFNRVTGGTAKYVKMLVENYTIRQTGEITNFPDADITLTTALRSDTSHPYRGTEGTVCTISRTSGSTQLFKLSNNNAKFELKNITLDGRNDKSAMTGDRRLIQVDAGELIVDSGTTMQYGKASNGGAIDAAQNAKVTVNGSCDTETKKPTVRFINCSAVGNNKPNGGAIRAYDLTIENDSETTGQYGTAFINCSAYNGGAITSLGSSMSIAGVFFDGCVSQSAGGAIYHDNSDAGSLTNVINCAFEECMTTGNNWAHGGAIEARTASLSVEDCSFTNCQAKSDGGAVYHGLVDGNNKPSGNRVLTSIKNTTFDGCSTSGTDRSYNYGGSVYTQAKTVEVTGSSFKNSTATNHGGAIYCQCSITDSGSTISGTYFENCSTSRILDGAGGAIYCSSKTLTLQDYEPEGSKKTSTTITGCKATQYSGAVHMETSASVLNISGNTKISSCYANKGGAIYLKKDSDIKMNISGSPEFTNNGYFTRNGDVVEAEKGACIYLEQGSRLNLSGSPKFSRNILPNQERIPNGGVSDNVRQDIYLAGYKSENAASIYVTGKLTTDENMIWVWPEESPHRLPNEQFAKIGRTDIDDSSLNCLRNALSDTDTGCNYGEYLAGVRIGTDIENIYWDKMYTVSFKKKDNKAVGVPGAGFTLYKDMDCTSVVAEAFSVDGDTQTKGRVTFTSISIGAYYMKETTVPESFKANNATYLVLVGTPYLSNTTVSKDLWEGDGPLNVPDAEVLVARLTTDANKYYGIFPLDANKKAILRANLASNTVGIENIRSDYPVSFMKVDNKGKALPGAAFTIYSQMKDAEGNPETFYDGYPKLMRWSRDGETYPAPVKSADGTDAYKDIDNKTLPKGTVYFRELPLGTYFLLETEYPGRNGDGERTFFVESDHVYKLEVKADELLHNITWELYIWQAIEGSTTGEYKELDKNSDGLYVVSNEEAVCKLTDSQDNLLYVEGRPVWDNTGSVDRRFPALYTSLENGFTAAQDGKLVDVRGNPVADDDRNPDLKLQVLKDLTLEQPVTYISPRNLTFTTASTTEKPADRYVFSTKRTSDTSRAEIKRGYTEYDSASGTAVNGALITIDDGAQMSLTNIKLNGMKTNQTGRALHVKDGKLNIGRSTSLQNFRQTVASNDGIVRGGAILMEDRTELDMDGGSRRTAAFSGNEVIGGNGDAEGGAIALGDNCKVSISNAQFTDNKVNATGDNAGNGGAISLGKNIIMTLTNGVFTLNTAILGSAVYAGKNNEITIKNGSIKGNKASGKNGGAINLDGNVVPILPDNFAKIYLEGDPVIYDNTDNTGKNQRNIVLSVDSNGAINTTGNGLAENAKIGVYVIDGEKLFDKHGRESLPFATFNNSDKNRNHPETFHNDRDSKLYGVLSKAESEEEDDYYIIYWSAPEGSRKVILRKVDAGFNPLSDATFRLMKGSTVIKIDGKDSLSSGSSGIIYAGVLDYGEYELVETSQGNRTFRFKVDDNGVTALDPVDDSKPTEVYPDE